MKTFLNFIFCITLLTLIYSCHRNKSNNGQISTDVVNNTNTVSGTKKGDEPILKFETETHDFGKVIQGEKVVFSFKFKNAGKSDLLISDAYASCGCTIPKFSKEPIKPGDEGVIEVAFNTEGKKGFEEKTVTVIANTQPNEKQLKIKANVYLPEDAKK